ncbi:MAG: isoamylase early set domain-containing protein [bacterium]|nr:MAG: isoamylase early set domain-containing protein [bacterium]
MMNRTGALCIAFTILVGCIGCGTGLPEWRRGSDKDIGPQFLERGVQFSIYAPKAARVTLVGDFNNWSTTADPLFNREGEGVWTIVIPLPPGRYEYKFLIDSEKWIPDPGNPEVVDDGFQGLNSVLTVPGGQE